VCCYLFLDCGKIPLINKCVDVSTNRHWVWQFKQGEVREASLFDKTRLGRPVTATDESSQEYFEELALEDHGII
jgi:hypothetical protein